MTKATSVWFVLVVSLTVAAVPVANPVLALPPVAPPGQTGQTLGDGNGDSV